MTAEPETKRRVLLEYFAQWRRLTEAESEQIRLGNWKQLHSTQASKQQLQESIKEATDALRSVSPVEPLQREGVEREIQTVVHDLMKMEIHNRNELHMRHEQARAMIQETDIARSTLRLVHKAYAPTRPAVWQSYS